MIAVVVTVSVHPERIEQFLEAMRANASAAVRDEPGCLGFDVVELDGEPGRFLLYERYADEEAFADHQRQSHFAAWSQVAPTVLVGDRERLTGHVVS